MKTVFNNEMVAHVWAQQIQDSGNSSNGSFSFNGSKLESYSTVIAKFVKSDLVLIKSSSYSVTTANHISMARRALSNEYTFNVPNVEIKLGTKHEYSKQQNKKYHAENVAYYKNEINQTVLSASKARQNKETLNGKAINLMIECNQYIDFFKLRCKAVELPKVEQIKLEAEKSKKAKIRKDKALLAKKLKDNKENIAGWLAGENKPIPYGIDTMIRLKGDIIQTSKGASFPASHGYLALPIIKKCKDTKTAFKTNGKTINLGHFKIDWIDIHGNVKAGCHNVKFEQIIRIENDLIEWREANKVVK